MHDPKQSSSFERTQPLLERVTALVLLAVLLSVAWMVLVSYQPDTFRLASLGAEVSLVLLLLFTALLLVTALALLHTAPAPDTESSSLRR
jgi:hypothetical protein